MRDFQPRQIRNTLISPSVRRSSIAPLTVIYILFVMLCQTMAQNLTATVIPHSPPFPLTPTSEFSVVFYMDNVVFITPLPLMITAHGSSPPHSSTTDHCIHYHSPLINTPNAPASYTGHCLLINAHCSPFPPPLFFLNHSPLMIPKKERHPYAALKLNH